MDEWTLVFYETAAGNSPVLEFLGELSKVDAVRAARDLNLLQTLGIQLGMPHVRHLEGSELWELRIRGRRHHRIFYVAIHGQRMLLLHGFTKKSEKTPAREIQTATVRLADYRERHEQ
jgi:phage-related protein